MHRSRRSRALQFAERSGVKSMNVAEFVEYLNARNISLWLDGDRIRYRGPETALEPHIMERLQQLRPELKRFLKNENRAGETYGEEGRESTTPATMAQESLLIMDRLADGNPADNVRMAQRIRGPLDAHALEKAFRTIVARHGTLRTGFGFDGNRFVQRVEASVEFNLALVDLSRDIAPEEALQRHLGAEAAEPFDLTEPPLLRATLYRVAPGEHILMVVLHHTIADGWSTQLMANELGALYPAGNEQTVPELAASYEDYARRERADLGGQAVAAQIDYWSQRLRGLEPLRLPSDFPRPSVPSFRGGRVLFSIPPDLYGSARELGRSMGATPYMTIMAAFVTLLHRHADDTDIAVGMPVSTRPLELENLIGMFLNVLVLRVDLVGDPSFRELLKAVREASLDAFVNRDAPFERVVAAVQPDRDSSRNPMFQVMLQLSDEQELNLQGLSTEPEDHDPATSQFDLTLHLYHSADQVRGYFEYSTDLYAKETVERMAGHLLQIIEAVVEDPDRRLSSVTLLTAREAEQMNEWNSTGVDYPVTTLKELFEQQVTRTPDVIALKLGNETRTYAELNERANRLAHYLSDQGVGPESRVGILMERSLDMMEAIYAVIKAGGAYVPLDPEYPAERISLMIEDAETQAVITQDHLRAEVPPGDHQLISLQQDWPDIAVYPANNPAPNLVADNLAYIIFTSGSTGRPKGVMNEHGGVCNRILWTQDAFQLDETDRIMQKTPISFDVSVWELFWPLAVGARLVMAEPGGHRDPQYLRRLVEKEGITTIHFVPSMLNQLLDSGPTKQETATLRRVICSGEALARDLQDRFFASVDAELHNLYGPTEAAVDVTWWVCDPDSLLSFVPIGTPVSNTHIYVVDGGMQRCPVGVAGELLIGGAQVARGYVSRPTLTRDRFIPDVFNERAGARLYRTGDLARFLPDGTIQYLGRTDNQIKLRGYRIELGEIEAVLSKHPGVQQAVVQLQQFESGDGRLIGYLLSDETGPSVNSLQEFLRERVPEYMVPALFVTLDALPFLPNGKVDRKSLPIPEDTRPELESSFQAPGTPAETTIAEIWKEILRIEEVGVNDNFFDLGGNSLLLMQMRNRMEKALQVDVPVLELFRHSTVSMLARFITAEPQEDVSLDEAKNRADKQQAALMRLRQAESSGKGS